MTPEGLREVEASIARWIQTNYAFDVPTLSHPADPWDRSPTNTELALLDGLISAGFKVEALRIDPDGELQIRMQRP